MKILLFAIIALAGQSALAKNEVTINIKQGKKLCRYHATYHLDKYIRSTGTTDASLTLFPSISMKRYDDKNETKFLSNGCLNVMGVDLVINKYWLTKNDNKLAARISQVMSNGTINEINFNYKDGTWKNEGKMKQITWKLEDPKSEKEITYMSYAQRVRVNLDSLSNAQEILDAVR